jgi:hypothetical protein
MMFGPFLAPPPANAPPRCCGYFVWLGWCDWRVQRRAARSSSAPAATARQLACAAFGAGLLLAGVAALAALAGPPMVRLAERAGASSLAQASAFVLTATVLALTGRQLVRAAYFVEQLCARGRCLHLARMGHC